MENTLYQINFSPRELEQVISSVEHELDDWTQFNIEHTTTKDLTWLLSRLRSAQKVLWHESDFAG